MVIEYECPHCGQLLRIPELYAGQRGTCKKCGGKIVVPSLSTPPALPTSPSREESAKPHNAPKIRHMFSKIFGVTHDNDDGSNRQKLIKKYCRAGMQLEMIHDPDNPHDSNAISLTDKKGHQFGFVNCDLSAEIVAKVARGYQYGATITKTTGGGRNKSLGVNIIIVVADANASQKDVQKYVETIDIS